MRNCSTSLICLNQIDIYNEFDKILNIGKFKKNCNYNWAHADFMDGHFVPRLGISPELIKHLREHYNDKIIIDSHMMIDDPFTYADVVCPYSDYYMFHVEAVTDPMRTIQKIRKNWPNIKVGLYFNLSSDIKNYLYILDEIDCIGLMGISPGVLGTNSYPDIITGKLLDYNSLFTNKMIHRSTPHEFFIDGSVNFKTIHEYFKIGATTLVCGSSSIVKKDENEFVNFEKNINRIEESLN